MSQHPRTLPTSVPRASHARYSLRWFTWLVWDNMIFWYSEKGECWKGLSSYQKEVPRHGLYLPLNFTSTYTFQISEILDLLINTHITQQVMSPALYHKIQHLLHCAIDEGRCIVVVLVLSERADIYSALVRELIKRAD